MDYGGRGIKVCVRWRKFENFLADMGPCPAGFSIERKNNDRGYSPSNCVWADRQTQARNTRRNVWLTYKGETMCQRDWAAHLGITHSAMQERIARELPPDKLFAPKMRDTPVHYITHNGMTMNVSDWAKYLGIKRSALAMRLSVYGWTIERSLTCGCSF